MIKINRSYKKVEWSGLTHEKMRYKGVTPYERRAVAFYATIFLITEMLLETSLIACAIFPYSFFLKMFIAMFLIVDIF